MKKAFIALAIVVAALLALLYRPPLSLEKLRAKYADETSFFTEVNGMPVHYRMSGSGEPVLLVHGTSSSLHTWQFWQPRLSEHFTVYSVDLPGCGLTGPHPQNDYSISGFLEFLDAFTAAVGLDSFHIAGNSLGGHIAWEYARQRPDIGKVILVDPSGFYKPDRNLPLAFKLGRMPVFSRLVENLNVWPLIGKSLREVYFNDAQVTPELERRYWDLIRRKGNRRAFVNKVSSFELSEPSELHNIHQPVLIQWGRQDLWIPLELAGIFTTNLPDNRLIVYEDCGHVPQEEIPDLSALDALDFLLDRPSADRHRTPFLLGNWLEAPGEGDSRTGETWTMVNDSSYQGSGFTQSPDGQQQEGEKLWLNRRNGAWQYEARPAGQDAAVGFAQVRFEGDRHRFENPENDFPAYIEYHQVAPDTVMATIGDSARSVSWTYIRQP